jgi:hypothetical protein
MRKGPVVAALVIGLGLAAAPLAFQMFGRAPKGGDMLDDFRPFMTDEVIDKFKHDVAEIDAAETETQQELRPFLVESGGVTDAQFDEQFPFVATFSEEWPDIDEDMSGMLDDVGENVDNFEAVDALPPFPLFPWFFVLPGLMIAVVAAVALRRSRRDKPVGRILWVLAGLGVALIAAPAVFQMFTRAPAGSEMIDTFRPIMPREHVQDIQGYFVAIGGAEGSLRTQLLPLAQDQGGLNDSDLDDRFPAARALNRDWQTIVAADTGLAAMVGTMSDNVDNYEAVDALPDFWLFPWFFVIPGVLVGVLALLARPGARSAAPAAVRTPAGTSETLEPSVTQRSTR